MSGHNKWSKVKHKKAATDAVKSKVFSKLTHLIAMESRKAGGDASSPSLRAIIEKARAANMPSENIERAVKKWSGEGEVILESVTYEAYGSGGAALIIEAITDNKNRAAGEIKHILSDHGSSLAAPGSALWAFEKTADGWQPKTSVELKEEEREKLESLMDDLEACDEVNEVFTNASAPEL